MNRFAKPLALLVALALFSCGEDRGPRVVDPLLLPYVEEFETAARGHGLAGFAVTSSLMFADIPDVPGFETGGVCLSGDGGNTVFLSTDFADALDAGRGVFGLPGPATGGDALRVAIFHELGHCELGKPHLPVDGYPEIMSPGSTGWASYLMEDWESHVAVLFR